MSDPTSALTGSMCERIWVHVWDPLFAICEMLQGLGCPGGFLRGALEDFRHGPRWTLCPAGASAEERKT